MSARLPLLSNFLAILLCAIPSNAAVTLHVSFDRGADAEQAIARRTPTRLPSTSRSVPGLIGQGIEVHDRGGLAYDAANIPSGRGSVCFWVSPLERVRLERKAGTSIFRADGPGPVVLEVDLRRIREDHRLQGTGAAPGRYARGWVAVDWRPGEWHQIVLTYEPDAFAFYLDGKEIRRQTAGVPALSGFSKFALLRGSVPWILDELTVLNVALSKEAVRSRFERNLTEALQGWEPRRPRSEQAQTPLVSDGRSAATLVLPVSPNGIERRAADEITDHVRKTSGVVLPTITEMQLRRQPVSGSIVFVGRTLAARQAGLLDGPLPLEGFRIDAKGGVIYLAGDDDLQYTFFYPRTRRGTYSAACSLLEHIGCRWLWPGSVGTVCPDREDIVVADFRADEAPDFELRHYWNFYMERHLERFDKHYKADRERYRALEREWLLWCARNRMGSGRYVARGHAFTRWWKRFGDEHPEYFALAPTLDPGVEPVFHRGPWHQQRTERLKLCVTNREALMMVHSLGRRALLRGAASYSACPNDSRGYCTCPRCQALDTVGWGRSNSRSRSWLPILSDRYASFWNFLDSQLGLEEALEDKRIGVYAYSDYRWPPRRASLKPHIVVYYVGGSNYSTWSGREAEHKVVADWAKRLDKMYLRPNMLHYGFGYPAWCPKVVAEDVRFWKTHKVMGFTGEGDFHMGSIGLNLYAMARMMWNADLDIRDVLDDYCDAAFGPAATSMREFLDYCADHYVLEMKRRTYTRRRSFAHQAPEIYRDAFFETVRPVLARAADAAETDAQRKRVAYFQALIRLADLQRQIIPLASAMPRMDFEHAWLLSPEIVDWPLFLAALRPGAPLTSSLRRVKDLLDPDLVAALAAQEPNRAPPEDLGERVVAEINRKIIANADLYRPREWDSASLPQKARRLLRRGSGKLGKEEARALNRSLLAGAFGGAIIPKPEKPSVLIDRLLTLMRAKDTLLDEWEDRFLVHRAHLMEREKSRWRDIYGHALRKMAEWDEDARKGLWRGEAFRIRAMAFRNVRKRQGVWAWHHTAFNGYVYLNRRTKANEAWLEWTCERPRSFKTCRLSFSGYTPEAEASILMFRISTDGGAAWQEVGRLAYPPRYANETIDITPLVKGRREFHLRIATPKGSACRIADIKVLDVLN